MQLADQMSVVWSLLAVSCTCDLDTAFEKLQTHRVHLSSSNISHHGHDRLQEYTRL